MSLGAFVSLEDISDALPPYREEIVSVEMDQPLQKAYEDLEQDIKKALREHRGNQSVASVALNALLAYPDRPYGFGDLIGREFNPETQRREPFLIAATCDLDENFVYAKERRLVEEIKCSLERGRKVQVYAVYTQKRDVTRRHPGSRAHDPGSTRRTRSMVRTPVTVRPSGMHCPPTFGSNRP
jgi:superfamily II DNA or RNA helicase